MQKTILEVINLRKSFPHRKGVFASLGGQSIPIPAVDNVNLSLQEHETLGLVGESGCGKTTVGRSILRLTPVTSGRILFDNRDVLAMLPEELRRMRGQMQMIFQDLDAALNPRMRVRDILSEAITVHNELSNAEAETRINGLLEQVNLKKSKLASFPHELSGGEKRRVGIARVLSVGPRFIVADEPTSALDVSIQAQIVNLLRDLQQQLGLSYLFISHDLRIVELVSHRVAVMYLGRIVEIGLSEHIANAPRHPYTRILWSSLVEKHSQEAFVASQAVRTDRWGVFDFEKPRTGCRFAPRCPMFISQGRPAICIEPASEPELKNIDDNSHQVACHFPL